MVLKFPLSKAERDMLFGLSQHKLTVLHKVAELQFLVPFEETKASPAHASIHHRKHFFCFPKLIRPMSREDARRCLGSFYKSVHQAIDLLHKIAFRAHSDIRLENICFRPLPEGSFQGDVYFCFIDRI